MGNTNRDSLSPPQAATIHSPAFQEWLKARQSEPDAPARPTSARTGSGSGSGFGSGSGTGGYGLGLISADIESQERIKRIMRDICEREKRNK